VAIARYGYAHACNKKPWYKVESCIHSDTSHVPASLVQQLLPSLAQNSARTHSTKFKRHYLFLKVCKKLTVQGVAYRKQPDIQEWQCCKSDSRGLPAI